MAFIEGAFEPNTSNSKTTDLAIGVVSAPELSLFTVVSLTEHSTKCSRCFVNGKMRGVLVDWLIEVHSQFKLLQETLYMTVYVIDKFLQVVSRLCYYAGNM